MIWHAMRMNAVMVMGQAMVAAGTVVGAGRMTLMALDRAGEARDVVTGEGHRMLADAIERVEDVLAEAAAADPGAPPVGPGEVVEGLVAGAVAGRDEILPVADVAHAAPGRLRLTLRRRDPASALALLADRLAALPGVEAVTVRATTGSIVLRTRVSPETLAEAAGRAGLLRVAGRARPRTGAAVMSMALDRVDALLRLQSGGRTGLADVMSLSAVAADVIGRDPGFARLTPRELMARILAEARRRRDRATVD